MLIRLGLAVGLMAFSVAGCGEPEPDLSGASETSGSAAAGKTGAGLLVENGSGVGGERLDQAGPSGGLAVQRTRLGPVADPDRSEVLNTSPNGRRVAVRVRLPEGGMRFEIDGEAGPVFDRLGSAVSFSRDGGSYAYAGMAGGKLYSVWDGQRDEMPDDLTVLGFDITPDGKRALALCAEPVVYELGVGPHPVYDELSNRGRWFASDSGPVVYRGKRGEVWHAVVDGESIAAYDAWPTLVFSEAGGRYAFYVEDADDPRLIVDGRPVAVPGRIEELAFTPGGGRLVVVHLNEREEYVTLLDGEPVGEPVYAGRPRLEFGPRGDQVLVTLEESGGVARYLNGQRLADDHPAVFALGPTDQVATLVPEPGTERERLRFGEAVSGPYDIHRSTWIDPQVSSNTLDIGYAFNEQGTRLVSVAIDRDPRRMSLLVNGSVVAEVGEGSARERFLRVGFMANGKTPLYQVESGYRRTWWAGPERLSETAALAGGYSPDGRSFVLLWPVWGDTDAEHQTEAVLLREGVVVGRTRVAGRAVEAGVWDEPGAGPVVFTDEGFSFLVSDPSGVYRAEVELGL